ncbi:MAG: hypothetical protein ACI90A_001456 [Shewanella sp.]|jgi:hypothetical protein
MMMKKTTKFMLSLVATAIALSGSTASATEQTEDGIKIGGAVRVNYAYRDYDETNKDKGGDFYFDMAAIKFDAKQGD